MTRTLSIVCGLISAILFALMLVMILVMDGVVFTRYFLSFTPSWSEEITRYCMVWMVMLGAAVLMLFEDHITLYVFVEKFPPRLRLLQRIAANAILLVVTYFVARDGFDYAFSMARVTANGSGMSMTVPTLAIAVGASLIMLAAAVLILGLVRQLLTGAPPPLPDQGKFMDSSFKPSHEEADTGRNAN